MHSSETFPLLGELFTCAQEDIYKKVHSNVASNREEVETPYIHPWKHRYVPGEYLGSS